MPYLDCLGMQQLHPGTLDLLVLQALKRQALHGYAIAAKLKEASADVLSIEEGTLYPALHRMERRGWLASEWGQTPSGRRARFYSVTEEGTAHFKQERTEWKKHSVMVGRMLRVKLA